MHFVHRRVSVRHQVISPILKHHTLISNKILNDIATWKTWLKVGVFFCMTGHNRLSIKKLSCTVHVYIYSDRIILILFNFVYHISFNIIKTHQKIFKMYKIHTYLFQIFQSMACPQRWIDIYRERSDQQNTCIGIPHCCKL